MPLKRETRHKYRQAVQSLGYNEESGERFVQKFCQFFYDIGNYIPLHGQIVARKQPATLTDL
jgi:hypothetical protein